MRCGLVNGRKWPEFLRGLLKILAVGGDTAREHWGFYMS